MSTRELPRRIETEAVDGNSDLSTVLRKCLVLGSRLTLPFAALTIANTAFAGIPAGTEIIINDPTNALVFCADSTKNLDQIMTDAEAQDWDALKELISEGHLISVKNGTHGKTIEFDPSENAYKVSVSGLNHPVWVIQQFVTATQ